MTPTHRGSFRLFRLAGIDVFLHWSWFVLAIWRVTNGGGSYPSPIWKVAEMVTLFLIVLLHEFGHSLACRSVGGEANRIVLWPLGGVAYVSPPQRAGATLWSIAAGPLVNLVLAPILTILAYWLGALQFDTPLPSALTFLRNICFINIGLLIFNLLPIYPLDGGQILRSLLWFVLGRANSLLVATIIGFVGVVGLAGLAFLWGDPWLWLVTAFILFSCLGGLFQALLLARMEKAPRRDNVRCPVCKVPPPVGEFWFCGKCRRKLDTFAAGATCPNCGNKFETTICLECRNSRPLSEWIIPPPLPGEPPR